MGLEGFEILVRSINDDYKEPALEAGADRYLSKKKDIDQLLEWASDQNDKVVVIVDDDKFAARILAEQLEANGATVHTFLNAEDALSQLENLKPDSLITDVDMPGMNGISLVEEVVSQFPKK